MRCDRPLPRCARPTAISTADPVSGARPCSRSLNAQIVTRSRPPSGSSRRPSASRANASARAVAATAPRLSSATAHRCGNAPATCQYSAFATGSLPMNSGQAESTS
jgi:hypothetical protein